MDNQKQQWTSSCLVRYCSNSADHRNKPLGGYEYKEEVEPFQSRWRKPFSDREGYWKSKFSLFANRKFQGGSTRLNPANFKHFSLKQWWFYHKKDKLIFNQKFIEERLNILGCDLAAAHFVVYRGGAVKFYNQTEWIRDDAKKNKEYDDKLPNTYKPEYVLEAVDFSGTQILYEGLKNIDNLKKLKWLSFEGCGFFDNWCLDRVTGEHWENLEYLNISHTNITWHALNSLYRLTNLKTLKIENWSDDPEFYMMCSEVRNNLPDLVIEGIPEEFLADENEVKARSDFESINFAQKNEERVFSKAKG